MDPVRIINPLKITTLRGCIFTDELMGSYFLMVGPLDNINVLCEVFLRFMKKVS